MPAPMSIALIDAESFYASCEAAFDPKLRGRPIVVLSNNDGCVVAANSIAKQIDPDIMFKPYFQIKTWAQTMGVAVRSSNYELYGAVSNRIANRRMLQRMQLLTLANEDYWSRLGWSTLTLTARSRVSQDPT